MDDPQFLKTPNGDELVVLSRHDYDTLVEALSEAEEELADIAKLDERLAELANTAAPSLPAEVSRLLLQGRSRFAAIRIWRGNSPAELAAKIGITEPELIAIEARHPAAKPDIVAKAAAALDVPHAWLES